MSSVENTSKQLSNHSSEMQTSLGLTSKFLQSVSFCSFISSFKNLEKLKVQTSLSLYTSSSNNISTGSLLQSQSQSRSQTPKKKRPKTSKETVAKLEPNSMLVSYTMHTVQNPTKQENTIQNILHTCSTLESRKQQNIFNTTKHALTT